MTASAARFVLVTLLVFTPALVGAGPPPAPAAVQTKNLILGLEGRWSGEGTVEWRSGRREPYSCVVTYYLSYGGSHVKQLLNCKSPGASKLDIATKMVVAGEVITGTWEDRQYSMNGAVSGRVTANGFEAVASNQLFNARFEIALAGACEQNVTITPSRDIAFITASLKKC